MLFPEGKNKALTLSYDDGVQQDIKMIEILDKYGIKCTFNLNSYSFEEDERSYAEGQIHRRMARREALEVYSKAIANGHEVATHGYSHPFLDKTPAEMVAYEIVEDRRVLEEMFGVIVKGHAYPFGTTSSAVVDILRKCGILYARTTGATKNFDIPTGWLTLPATCHHNNPELMQLVDKFLNETPRHPNPKLFYLWGHTYEFETNNNWEVIEKFSEAIGNRDDVWYANNMQIYQYVEAYRALEFSANGNMVYNPSALTVWFTTGGINVKVAPGETVKIR
jgi:peptidoglycan/xylan/chitin deacetylase (PgdA/CDA1 family)